MHYKILHRTSYHYEFPVTVGHYTARLEPRNLPVQACPWHRLVIRPEPSVRSFRADAFGNHVDYFEFEGAHQELEVISRSLVKVSASVPPQAFATPSWESIREGVLATGISPLTAAGAYAFGSPLIAPSAVFHAYAARSFPAGRPILEGVCDLNHRLHEDLPLIRQPRMRPRRSSRPLKSAGGSARTWPRS